MKSRFLILLLGMLLVPAVSRAQIPTLDIPGTIQAATEVGNTLNNVKESVTQVTQYQKTMAAIGTAKKNVSEFITKQKERLEKIKEKAEKYKQRVEEYVAKAQAYKAEVEGRINQVRDAVQQAKDKVDEVKDKIDEVKDKVDEAKDKVNEIKNKIGEAKEKLDELKSKMEEACINPDSDACKEASEAYNDAEEELTELNNEMENTCGDPNSDACKEITAAYEQSNATAKITNEVAAREVLSTKEVSSVKEVSSADLVDMPAIKSSRQPIMTTAAETAVESVAAVKAVAKEAATTAAPKQAAVKAVAKEAATTAAPKQAAVKAVAKEAVTTAAPKQAAVKAVAKEAATAAAKPAAASGTTKSIRKTAPAVSNQPVRRSVPAVQKPTRASFKTSSGYGFIHKRYPLAFASLSLDIGGNEGGETEDGILVVPDSLSLRCDINFEDAAKEGVYDACIRQTNNIIFSEITDEVSSKDNQDARRDLDNARVEYMAAAYFEALSVYNESMTFKNNVVDPILNSEVADVQNAWVYTKEINQALGTRINNLNRLWARALNLKTFSLYVMDGLQTPED